MVIGPAQCFLISVVFGAAVGARRGWNREVITAAIILATLLVLTLGGADALATWLSHGFVGTAQAHGLAYNAIAYSGGPQPTTPTQPSQSNTSNTSNPTPQAACIAGINGQVLSIIIFGGMTWLAYAVGKKYGAPPKTANHRIAGAIPGAINGASIAYFVSKTILPGQSVTLNTPGPSVTNAFLPLVLGLGLLCLLVVIFIAGQANKSGK
jgi:hypothetical protein